MEFSMIERLIDSVILIDHLNGIEKATEFVSRLNPKKTAISVITRAEILVGVTRKDEAIVKSLLDQYEILNIDKNVADQSARLRRKFRWRLPDAFQAALAIQYKIKLTTRNTKDFNPQHHDFVEIPYAI